MVERGESQGSRFSRTIDVLDRNFVRNIAPLVAVAALGNLSIAAKNVVSEGFARSQKAAVTKLHNRVSPISRPVTFPTRR